MWCVCLMGKVQQALREPDGTEQINIIIVTAESGDVRVT